MNKQAPFAIGVLTGIASTLPDEASETAMAAIEWLNEYIEEHEKEGDSE